MYKALGLALVAVGLFSCSRLPNEQRMEVKLASRLIGNCELASFSFCDSGPADWDSILVLKPYCPPEAMKQFGINNYLTTRLLAPNQESSDFSCTLIFLKKKSCVGYSVISREILDMTQLANEKDSNIALITRANCVKKLKRSEAYTGVVMID
jgi:hypothetical protein